MAITVIPEILGQGANQNCTYCYLYEPLKVAIKESDLSGEQIYIDLEVYETEDDTVLVETKIKYAVYDINPGAAISVDLMKLTRQYHDANVYVYANIGDIVSTGAGWHSVVSKYKYKFLVYSDETENPTHIYKLPIIGGRTFPKFSPVVENTQPLTELAWEGIDMVGRWIGEPIIYQSLADPTLQDARPTIISEIQSTGCYNEGYLIWKSRMGGWCTWGFDISVENNMGSYSGNLDSGYLSSTNTDGNGQPYIPVNYTGIESTYGYSLKALSLLTNELKGVSGIHYSPAIYYVRPDGQLELMRKSGASTPISTLSNGGDFSVTLKNISSSTQQTR
jgi:hypothetical protein